MSGFLTVSIGSGLNGTIYGDCQVPLKAFLESRGEAFQRESLLPYLYRMEKSRHWAERYSSETAMGDFEPVGEGGDYPKTGFEDGYFRDIVNMTFKQSFSVTQELVDQMNSAGYRAEVVSAYQTAGGAPYLDYTDTVLGQVYEGMDVVDAIGQAAVDENQKPTEAITINSVSIETYQ